MKCDMAFGPRHSTRLVELIENFRMVLKCSVTRLRCGAKQLRCDGRIESRGVIDDVAREER